MCSNRSDETDFDIVIGGGSFSGLSLARALSVCSSGALRVAVVDPVPRSTIRETDFDGRSFALSAASVKMLKAIGMWEDVSSFAQPITDIDITDSEVLASERQVFLYFDNRLNGDEPASFMVESGPLRAALMEAAIGDDGIVFISPDRIEGFSVDLNGVSIGLKSGKSLKSLLLVAADGRDSALREMAGIKTVGWSYDQVGLVATIGHDRPHNGRAIQHFMPSGPFAILPLTQNRSSLVWTEDADVARDVATYDDEQFLSHVKTRFGTRFGDLRLAGPRGAFPLRLQIARAYRSTRFALLADAAHAVHPIAGQGLNIGLRDVAALSELVIDASRLGLDIGSDVVLSQYERWRRFDSTSLAFAMDGVNRLFSNESGSLRALRDAGLGMVNKMPAVKAFFVREAAGLQGDLPKLLRGERV